MNIDRLLFWFADGNEKLITLNERFFAYGMLYTRLLNESYDGKKIKFINIDFATEKTYSLYPGLPKNTAYAYGGHLRFYGLLDLDAFMKLDKVDQNYLVWEKGYEHLVTLAGLTKNKALKSAAEHAYKHGLETELDPDYRVITSEITLYGVKLMASVWINFRPDGMYARLTVSKEHSVIFEQDIDKAHNGLEFFLVMYKAIEAADDAIVIKGRMDVDSLPLRIPIRKELVNA